MKTIHQIYEQKKRIINNFNEMILNRYGYNNKALMQKHARYYNMIRCLTMFYSENIYNKTNYNVCKNQLFNNSFYRLTAKQKEYIKNILAN